jgi:hypothetical protein
VSSAAAAAHGRYLPEGIVAPWQQCARNGHLAQSGQLWALMGMWLFRGISETP